MMRLFAIEAACGACGHQAVVFDHRVHGLSVFWNAHAHSPKKPLRVFISVGDRDLLNPNVMRDGMHDWVEANHRMAKVLKAKGYEYQYLFCRGQGHSVGNARAQFLPHAIEWVWKGHAPKKGK